MVLVIVTEITAMPSKKTAQIKIKKLISANNTKPRCSPSKEIIDQVWAKVKWLAETAYNKTFWTIAEFFDGKRSYTFKLFGKNIAIVIPRMPRSRKEAKRHLDAIQKAIRQNSSARCLVAIYLNIAIFVIGYAILFTYNIHCYFRCRQVWAAEDDRKPIFISDHYSIADSKSPRNPPSTVRKLGISNTPKFLVSPPETILDETVRSQIMGENALKKSSIDGSNRELALESGNDSLLNAEQLDSEISSHHSTVRKLSHEGGLSVIKTTLETLERNRELEEGYRKQLIVEEELEHRFLSDDSKNELLKSYRTSKKNFGLEAKIEYLFRSNTKVKIY
uniref:Uncharacterized protein n=1 Tax=Setaria digitata TaxID=48799 RepID=A0A915PYL6_9BILA